MYSLLGNRTRDQDQYRNIPNLLETRYPDYDYTQLKFHNNKKQIIETNRIPNSLDLTKNKQIKQIRIFHYENATKIGKQI